MTRPKSFVFVWFTPRVTAFASKIYAGSCFVERELTS